MQQVRFLERYQGLGPCDCKSLWMRDDTKKSKGANRCRVMALRTFGSFWSSQCRNEGATPRMALFTVDVRIPGVCRRQLLFQSKGVQITDGAVETAVPRCSDRQQLRQLLRHSLD